MASLLDCVWQQQQPERKKEKRQKKRTSKIKERKNFIVLFRVEFYIWKKSQSLRISTKNTEPISIWIHLCKSIKLQLNSSCSFVFHAFIVVVVVVVVFSYQNDVSTPSDAFLRIECDVVRHLFFKRLFWLLNNILLFVFVVFRKEFFFDYPPKNNQKAYQKQWTSPQKKKLLSVKHFSHDS